MFIEANWWLSNYKGILSVKIKLKLARLMLRKVYIILAQFSIGKRLIIIRSLRQVSRLAGIRKQKNYSRPEPCIPLFRCSTVSTRSSHFFYMLSVTFSEVTMILHTHTHQDKNKKHPKGLYAPFDCSSPRLLTEFSICA